MASRGTTVQLDHMYSADFETCDDYSLPIDKLIIDKITGKIQVIYPQRVWLAGFKNLETMKSSYFTHIDDFMQKILARGDNQNTEYAFHNLKFDGSFIVPWLLRRGYTVSQGRPDKGEFSVLIDRMNNWYTIVIQPTKRRKVVIWDSHKLFPTALKNLHEIYGTPTKKLFETAEFYNEVRGEDHITTPHELQYFENDLQVLGEALNEHIKVYGLQFKKTQASQAFNQFEKHFPSWKRRFPPLDPLTDKKIRRAYWGGLSYVNPLHQGKDIFNIGLYDINSSYPYQQAYKKLPYGTPLASYGVGQNPDMSKFWVAEAIVKFKLKPGKLPCIPKKALTEGEPEDQDKWLENSFGAVMMTFCSIDYITIQQSYKFEVIRWMWSTHWAQKVHPEVQEYILMNNETKVKYKKLAADIVDELLKIQYSSMSNRAKINNNGYYGKFGEDIIKEGKTPYLIEDEVEYIMDREELQKEGKRKFLPVAIATTAWGRQQLITMGNALQDKFVYCDTDSIHFIEEGGSELVKAAEDRGEFKISKTELGAWKYEGRFDRGRYLRSKCYYEENYNDLFPEVTVAGLPADPVLEHEVTLHFNKSKRRTCCTWDNFHIGLYIPGGNGKLQSVRTRTGNKLIPTSFEIKENDNLFGF